MDTPDPLAGHVLVLFDGVCNLCNGFVRFIITRDRAAKFRFASLQSDFARVLLAKHGLDPNAMHSVIVIDEDHLFSTERCRPSHRGALARLMACAERA